MCRFFGPTIIERQEEGERVMTPTIQAFRQQLPDTELDAIIGDKKGEHKRALVQHMRKKQSYFDKDKDALVPASGDHLGTMVAFKVGDELFFGYSMFNRKRESISMATREGTRIAIARTLGNRGRGKYLVETKRTPQEPESVTGFAYSGGNKVPFRVQERAPAFIARAMQYFKIPFSNVEFGEGVIIYKDARKAAQAG